ncbi:MAG TPA: hypothetical protein VG078_08615 [Acidimicrobiales bacterium]|nr:hypothetical protein [Acidimicrobiales bacterium]
MACGTPVACSDTPAFTELTDDAAVRFPADDPAAIAAAIAEGIDRRDELSRRGLPGRPPTRRPAPPP